jgi:NitT/TauT family transport system ATP-binding protein
MNSINFTDSGLPNIVELKNIKQVYNDPKKGLITVIDGLNCVIENKPNQGQFVVILGHSGCGKSTILRYIAGLQEPTGGEILIKGKPRDKKFHIGMVFQQYSSFPWFSVLDNVALGLKYSNVSRKERTERAMEMIKLVGLEGHEKKYAKYPTLSGGQLQRVAIARSLLANPGILLMDEPFGALDIHTKLKMQQLLCDMWLRLSEKDFGTTVIFVTHNIPQAVYLADEIWIMASNPGRIVDRIFVDFPLHRTQDMKRQKKFTDLVYDIEDRLVKYGSSY